MNKLLLKYYCKLKCLACEFLKSKPCHILSKYASHYHKMPHFYKTISTLCHVNVHLVEKFIQRWYEIEWIILPPQTFTHTKWMIDLCFVWCVRVCGTGRNRWIMPHPFKKEFLFVVLVHIHCVDAIGIIILS